MTFESWEPAWQKPSRVRPRPRHRVRPSSSLHGTPMHALRSAHSETMASVPLRTLLPCRFLAVLLAVLLLAGARLAGAAAPDPVAGLYEWVVSDYRGGLPDAGERRRLAHWLAPSLLRLLRSASTHETRCIRAAEPGEKPRMIEGNLFSGDQEPSSRFHAHAAQEIAGRRWQQVELIWVPDPASHQKEPFVTRVRVRLRRHDGGWRIDDIVYRDGRALSTALAGYVLETPCSTSWAQPDDDMEANKL